MPDDNSITTISASSSDSKPKTEEEKLRLINEIYQQTNKKMDEIYMNFLEEAKKLEKLNKKGGD